MTEPRPDFQNTEIAFKQWNDHDLYRAWVLFKTIDIKPLVTIGPPLVEIALKLKLPVTGLLKPTVFRQFCGGESLQDCQKTIDRLSAGNVFSILDYGVEGESTEAGFDAAMREVLRTIDVARENARIPFCVFKMTALARFGLLESASKVEKPEELSSELLKEWERAANRVRTICQSAVAAGKMVMIDAEETWIQPAIDRLAYTMMRQYNREAAKIYTTIQMYRTEGLDEVSRLLKIAQVEGWKPGIKLVRGAYMEKERERAKITSTFSPIHASKKITDQAYDDAVAVILSSSLGVSLCAGTHNSASVVRSINQMEQSQLTPSSPRIWFAQLLGMSDDLTFNLAHAGYNAAKYVPYGPVDAVLPYLFRRARENTSISGQSSRELLLIQRELKRRRQLPA